jgi:hypothetical protein
MTNHASRGHGPQRRQLRAAVVDAEVPGTTTWLFSTAGCRPGLHRAAGGARRRHTCRCRCPTSRWHHRATRWWRRRPSWTSYRASQKLDAAARNALDPVEHVPGVLNRLPVHPESGCGRLFQTAEQLREEFEVLLYESPVADSPMWRWCQRRAQPAGHGNSRARVTSVPGVERLAATPTTRWPKKLRPFAALFD